VNKSGAMKFVFMFKVLSVIYFFNFFISMFFYIGVMQFCVAKVGWLLQVKNLCSIVQEFAAEE
jgi:nucleoside permease NupC